MTGRTMMYLCVLLTLVSVLLGGCQPVQRLPAMVSQGSITGSLDFAVPDWGLEHGWFQFNVLAPQQEGGTPTGWVRWVEVNANQELRYVMAEPRCATFSEDGKSAVITARPADPEKLHTARPRREWRASRRQLAAGTAPPR